ncbi:hypothetical protein CERSUDRAFT_88076 [Gelatoporia subvermispora B]|uniref:FAD-binding FR-type domain-containing protein n=1 Tax=Ceriporiopsis subvermispora (strain B) TaxID=914234 RepID=M2Q6L8_CERS8|nr:hypothetical protein CERSUDRAFT_88076 [Gelatoporia subvermispora B]
MPTLVTPVSAAAAAAPTASHATTTAASTSTAVSPANLLFNVDLFLISLLLAALLLVLPRLVNRYRYLAQWDGLFLRHEDLPSSIPFPSALSRSNTLVNPEPLTREKSMNEKEAALGHSKSISRSKSSGHARTHSRTHSRTHNRQLSRHRLPPVAPTPAYIMPAFGTDPFAAQTNVYDNDYATSETHADLARNPSSASSHALLLRSNTATTVSSLNRPRGKIPDHMPQLLTLVPYLWTMMRTVPTFPITYARSLLYLTYVVALLYAGLYKSNPFTDPVRAGWVAVSQIPFVILFAVKNSFLGAIGGWGYEMLNHFHQFAGRFFVLAVNAHALGYIYSWTAGGSFISHLKSPTMLAGFVGLLATDVLLVFSFRLVRERAYTFFKTMHIIGVIALFAGVYVHSASTRPYLYAAVVLLLFSLVLRGIKSKVATAQLYPIPALKATRIEVRGINAGWRAGMHVRVRVLGGAHGSPGMGVRGWESHPFTIANVSKNPNGTGLVLIVKAAGDWTNRLYDLARTAAAAGYSEKQVDAETQGPASVKMMIEGPYGGPGHAMLNSFSGILLVAGGSGITFALAAAEELIQTVRAGKSRVRHARIVWSVPDASNLVPMLPTFAAMLAGASSTRTALHIDVFYTRASADRAPQLTLPPGLTLTPGRPPMPKLLNATLDGASALFRGGRERHGGQLSGLFVGVCGPESLGDEVGKAVSAIGQDRRKRIGGIELHKEIFGW